MATCAFEGGATFEVDRKRYTLRRKISERLWLAEEFRTLKPEQFEGDELLRLYATGSLRFITTPGDLPVTRDRQFIDPDDKRFPMARVRLRYLKALEGLPGSRRMIAPVIKETWEKIKLPEGGPPNPATVLRWRRRYGLTDKKIEGLFDRTDRQGNRSPRFDSEVEAIVSKAIDVKYLCRERGTLTDVLDEACAQVTRANRLLVPSEQLRNPTYWMVRRMVQDIPAFDRCIARHGREEANRRFRGMAGHVNVDAPLVRVEMDHTPIDLVVADDRTGIPLGRPYLTACIDTYSRCILGIHISFEPPSYLTVSKCLKNAIMPKADIRARYPTINSDWPAYGLMDQLVVDNGLEFHSQSLENACLALGIEIVYAPRKTPWFKGRIERFFRTFSGDVAHKAPGTTFSNTHDKADYDPTKEAAIGYVALLEIVHKWIADVYHQRPHRALKAPPANAWRSGIDPEVIRLPDDPTLLDAVLAQSEERTLTHSGIEYAGLFYNSSELQQLRRTLSEKVKVDVRVDRSDLGSIVVLTDERRRYIKVPALDQDYAAGLTQWSHDAIKRFAADKLEKAGNEGWREAKAIIGEMVRNQFHLQKGRTRKRMARWLDEQLKGGERPPEPRATAASAEPTTGSAPPSEDDSGTPRPRKSFKTVYRERSRSQEDDGESEGAQHE